MMTVAGQATYERHRAARTSRRGFQGALREVGLPMLLFGSMGAITWAIRGTDGWGGIDGTIVPGMTWGLLWYYVCLRKGIDARGIPLWLGFGIALGGELGYGQYVSWIQGRFYAGDATIPVSPGLGYAWFVIAGIGWGAPGGILLGWALNNKVSVTRWLVRALLLLVFLAVLLNLGASFLGSGSVDWLGKWFLDSCPWLVFPNSGLGIYAGELDKHLARTVYTNTQNFAVLIWWIAAMLVAALERDRATLVCGALIGGGFGIGFTLGALWCLGFTYAPGYIDWWKVWELQAGFNLGLLYTAALTFAIRRVDKDHQPDGAALVENRKTPTALGGRWRDFSLMLAVAVLFWILFRGATSRLGVLLELYDPKDVNQYQWPASRTALFALAALAILAAALYRTWRIARSPRVSGLPESPSPRLPDRVVDLMMVIGVVGAVTIWPAEIGALYACFLAVAIFAFNRLNRSLDAVDIGSASWHERKRPVW